MLILLYRERKRFKTGVGKTPMTVLYSGFSDAGVSDSVLLLALIYTGHIDGVNWVSCDLVSAVYEAMIYYRGFDDMNI